MEKNNLDNLFRGNLKDFKKAPDDAVWDKIQASLDKKQKKRIVPIWWQLGGVAALLAILFYAINPFDTAESNDQIIITDTQNKNATQDSNTDDSNNVVPNNSNEEHTITPTEITSVDSAKQNKTQSEEEESIVVAKVNKDQKTTDSRANSLANNSTEQKLVEKNNTNQTKSPITNKANTSQNSAIAEVKQKDGSIDATNNSTENQIIGKHTKEEAIAQVEETEEEKDKISIFDAIAAQNKDEEIETTEKAESRWAMGPAVAPVFFDAQGQGSPIHSNFAANTKSGNINLSYGVQVAYGVSKRLSVRTGVHRVDFGYDTNEVVFSSSLQASTNNLIDNITYSRASRNLVVESKSSNSSAVNANDFSQSEFNAVSPALEGRMVQQMGYIEVPFELNYALVDKKLGVNVIGGVSSLFLINNAVSLESEGLITEMGQANNLNDVNFSTNIGLGFNYEFSPKVQLNLEPLFKYQLNTFSDTAGRFRPYTLGVYSGISFKF